MSKRLELWSYANHELSDAQDALGQLMTAEHTVADRALARKAWGIVEKLRRRIETRARNR